MIPFCAFILAECVMRHMDICMYIYVYIYILVYAGVGRARWVAHCVQFCPLDGVWGEQATAPPPHPARTLARYTNQSQYPDTEPTIDSFSMTWYATQSQYPDTEPTIDLFALTWYRTQSPYPDHYDIIEILLLWRKTMKKNHTKTHIILNQQFIYCPSHDIPLSRIDG